MARAVASISTSRRVLRTSTALLVIVAVLGLVGPTSVAFAHGVRGSEVGRWVLSNVRVEARGQADEGVVSVRRHGRTTILTRGNASIPDVLVDRGWIHVGDPDSHAGYVIDAYQGTAAARSILYVITAPDGRRTYLEHHLVPGERYHNSFAAFSPDGRWFVSGEWGPTDRLLVFRVPGARATTPARPAPLRLASSIELDRTVRDVQGCSFTSTTRLLCTSSDTTGTAFPVADPLLAVRLDRPVGRDIADGRVHLLGGLPQDATCAGAGEAEGLDVRGRTLTVSVNSPCRAVTIVNTLHLEGA